MNDKALCSDDVNPNTTPCFKSNLRRKPIVGFPIRITNLMTQVSQVAKYL